MVFPQSLRTDGRVGLALVLLGCLLAASGAVPHVIALSDGASDYTVELTTTSPDATPTVQYDALPASEQRALADTTVDARPVSLVSHEVSTKYTPESIDVPVDEPVRLDTAPTGFADGDIVLVLNHPAVNHQQRALAGGTIRDKYTVTVTERPEPLNVKNYGLAYGGLLVVALGFRQREEVSRD